jgi:hypothetical protein
MRAPRWRSWLRHCATNRQVAGSIHNGVIGFFHWHNLVGRTMAMGSTQPLTEMGTRNISWGVNVAGAYGWQPTTFMCRLSITLEASTSWNPKGLSRPVMGLLYLFTVLYVPYRLILVGHVWNLKACYHLHNNRTLYSVQSQMTPVHTLMPCFFNNCFNLLKPSGNFTYHKV